MDLWQLYIFVSVIENKSFSKASVAINLSQPTVSSHIKDLENYFECRLLDRLGKTTEPTRAGQLLYRYAKEMLSLKQRAESAMFDFLGNTKGDLIIGGSTIPSGYIIPRLMGLFSQKFPEISIQLQTGDTMQIVSDIINGHIEAGIVGARVEDALIRQEKLIADQMKLVVPAGHKWAKKTEIDCSSLEGEIIIGREKGSGTWRSVLNSMIQSGFNPEKLTTSIIMGNTTSVIQGILNGVGISILSTIAVRDDIDSGRLTALSVKGIDLDRYFYLTLPQKRIRSPICEKFIAFAKQQLQKQAAG